MGFFDFGFFEGKEHNKPFIGSFVRRANPIWISPSPAFWALKIGNMKDHLEISAIHAPIPSHREDEIGHRLVGLIRALDNTTDGSTTLEQICRILSYLIEIGVRRGILQNDEDKAKLVLGQANSSTTNDTKTKGEELPVGGESLDEGLIFTGILRLCSDYKTQNSYAIGLSALWVLGVSEYVRNNRRADDCALAEQELLGKNFKRIFSSFLSCIDGILHNAPEFLFQLELEELEVFTIVSCSKAMVSLLGIFGKKLARNTNVLSDLNQMSWRLLTSSNKEVCMVGAKMIGVLPIAGGVDRSTQSEAWNKAVDSVLASLIKFSTFIGTKPADKKNQSSLEESISGSSNVVLRWSEYIRGSVKDKAAPTIIALQSLSSSFIALIRREFVHDDEMVSFAGISLDMELVFSLLETLLSFPLSAEGNYYRTKKSLRKEPSDESGLTPYELAFQIAPIVKKVGHKLFDTVLQVIGGPILLPHARRFFRIAHASLLTSCSGAVRKVFDPISSSQLEGKRRRWIHTAITLRTLSVDSCRLVVCAFGADVGGTLSASSVSERSSDTDGEKTCRLITGSTLEQLAWEGGLAAHDDEFGSFNERVSHFVACVEYLLEHLSSAGSFMSMSTRSLVDDMVFTILVSCQAENRKGVLISTRSHGACLRLGMQTLVTAWPDGAKSLIHETLRQTAHQFTNSTDGNLRSLAGQASVLCGSMTVVRAPPLIQVSRSVDRPKTYRHEELSIGSLLEKIVGAGATARHESGSQDATTPAKRKKTQEESSRQVVKHSKQDSGLKQGPPDLQGPTKALPDHRSVSKRSEMPLSKPTDLPTKTGSDASSLAEKHKSDDKMEDSLAPDENSSGVKGEATKEPMALIKKTEASVERGKSDDEMDDDFPDIVDDGPDSEDDE